MIELTTEYIISQVLVVIMYIMLCATYFFKNREKILFMSVVLNALQSASFLFIGGFTGMSMCFFNIARDTFLYLDSKNKKQSELLTNRDYVVLIVLLIVITIMSVISYDNIWSVLTILGTVISTISVWQKRPRLYKLLGIPVSWLYLGYHIALKSIFAIMLEGILFISTIVGYILDVKKSKNKENKFA